MGPIQTLDELRSWLFRRLGLILLVATVVTAVGVLVALNTQQVYRASAVIQIQDLAQPGSTGPGGTLSVSATRRIQAIEQRMMSRENLLALGDRYGLFDGTALSPAERHQLMRESITIEAVTAMTSGFTRDGSLAALIVSASAATAQVAADMANELAEELVRENVAARRERAEARLQFYRTEEERVEGLIRVIEGEITEFQAINEDVMPGALALRRDELGRLNDARLDLQREVNEARGELDGLDSSGRGVTQRRITQLNELILRRQAEIVELNAQVAAIQALFQRGSELELQVNALNRRMTALQEQLASVIERRREAEIAMRLEGDDQTERLELLDAALPPDYPVSRSRTMLVALAGLAGVMAGLGLAYLAEWMRPVLRNAAMFERELQLRPVISLPYQLPQRERRRRQMIWLAGLGLMGLGGLAFALAAGLV